MRNKRVVSSLLAIGLVASLFVSALSVSAHHVDDDDVFDFENNAFANPFESFWAHSYFPWVPNDNEVEDMGAYTGAVTVQNLEHQDIEVDFLVGTGDGWDNVESVALAPHESITLDADHLDVPAPGASVVAAGYIDRGTVCSEFDYDDEDERQEGLDLGCEENEDEDDWANPDQTVEDGVYGRIAGTVKNVSPSGGDASTNSDDTSVDGYSGMTGLAVSFNFLDDIAEELEGENGSIPLPGIGDLLSSDGTYVLPIVQTNDGWNTHIRVANLDTSGGLTNTTVTLYGSGTQGYAGESQVINLQLRAGQVETIDLSDYVEEGWVGSAYVTSNAAIGAVAERYKVDDQMLITNVSQPEIPSGLAEAIGGFGDFDYEYGVHGALVFKEYNYWNTGISVANTDPVNHNSVTITYLGPTGNQVGQDTLTIPPRGQEYVYTPGTQDLGLTDGFVGSVRIDGTSPLHATIDQVKYFGDSQDVGHAMSYSPADNVLDAYIAMLAPIISVIDDIDDGDSGGFGIDFELTMPLVQKGNPETGGGDTSGIQLFNTNQSLAANVSIVFYGANGLPVAPTVVNNDADPIEISLGANQSYTLYTHEQSELSSGFEGSVVVDQSYGVDALEVDDPADLLSGGVVGVSNNVNYDVDGDGSVAFPMVQSLGIPDFLFGEVSD